MSFATPGLGDSDNCVNLLCSTPTVWTSWFWFPLQRNPGFEQVLPRTHFLLAGIEYGEFGRCEVWTRDILASVAVSRFHCLKSAGSYLPFFLLLEKKWVGVILPFYSDQL